MLLLNVTANISMNSCGVLILGILCIYRERKPATPDSLAFVVCNSLQFADRQSLPPELPQYVVASLKTDVPVAWELCGAVPVAATAPDRHW